MLPKGAFNDTLQKVPLKKAGHFTPSGADNLSHKVISLKERNFRMLKKDLLLRNPLRLLGDDSKTILQPGHFGAVLARAGVGKTAFIVQMALDSQLSGKNVLHVSLTDPVGKVDLWYQEAFRLLALHYKVQQIDQLWDAILPHRFIMSFKMEGFNLTKLSERLNDLTEQNIFLPQMLIIDGLPFRDSPMEALLDLKKFAQQHKLPVWFTIRTHRHEETTENGFPESLQALSDLFEITIQLVPEGDKIHIQPLKSGTTTEQAPDLFLDPETMLITE